MQKIIMLCGAPGVGKGMYSSMLAKDFGYVKISTGDEIRKVLNGTKPTTLTPKVLTQLRKSMNQGKLVPDEIIMEIIYEKIKEPASARGVILDGFPRTVAQLNMFTQVLPIHLVVNIEHSCEYLMASILGRRTCMDCGTSYSAFSFYKNGYELDVQMPEKEGECDQCGGHVTKRPDDKEDIVKARLKEYETKTYPLLKEMKQEGLLIPFEAKRGERDYPKLQQIIVSRIGLPYYYFQSYYKENNLAMAYD
jgi:adenylate kinase